MIRFKKLRSASKKAKPVEKEQCTVPDSSKSYTEDELGRILFSTSLAENLEIIKNIVGANADLVIKEIKLGRSGVKTAAILYLDNLIDSAILDQHIVRPLVLEAYTSGLQTGAEIIEQLQTGNLITTKEMIRGSSIKDLMNGLLLGEVGLLIDGVDCALVISAKGNDYRLVGETDTESVVRGPREAFVETLSVNIGLIRRRLQSPNLVVESVKIGNVTRTKVCFAYIRGICTSELVAEVRKRLGKMDIDGVLESGYIEEFIQDHPYSPFPQVGNTERPDRATAALLEGRVVIITDNTPIVLIVPGEFFSLLQAAEDYYNRYIFSTLVRFLRYFALAIALLLPAFYIAIVNYHQEMIPTPLLISIIASRMGVPLPAFFEALIMEVSFELLREAGVRLPKSVGQAVSIVGALVIGQAAVQAALVSSLMVIVVALTGIASFTIPQYNIALTIRVLRFPLMLLAAFLGVFGVMTGLLVIVMHMSSLRSFGVPYLAPVSPFNVGDLKDVAVRAPWWTLTGRPSQITRNSRRMPPGQEPRPPEKGGNP